MKLSRKVSFLLITASLLAAFLAGFIPQYWKQQEALTQSQQAQSQRIAMQEQLRLATLQNELGMILVEVEQNNFGSAKERSTRFFDDLRQILASTQDESVKLRLGAVLNRRDEVTSDLTMLNPETAAKLRGLYIELLPIATRGAPTQ